MLRIYRSSRADFEYDAERADAIYTDDELKSIADAGFNAVWVRTVCREMLPHPRYPSFGADSRRLLRSLNRVAERGARHGVQLVVFNQEPLGLRLTDPFWQAHPEMAGAVWNFEFGLSGDLFRMRAMCTTSSAVRDYLRESSAELLRRVPGISAIITITASEYMSHCYSHHGIGEAKPVSCPRCAPRRGTDVVVDVLNDMRDGMDQAAPATPLIAWNWSWVMYEADPQPSILSRIRPGIRILADFERGGWRTDPLGKRVMVDEYSLGYAGPSERFLAIRDLAAAQGRPVYAKLQVGTTHELASVSNLPLIPRLHQKAAACRRLGLAGFMGCWSFGNMRSLNTRAFAWFLSDGAPSDEQAALTALARREFPGCRTEDIVAAWQSFAAAFDCYPFSIPFLYEGPANYCLALPLHPGPYTPGSRITRSYMLDPRDADDDPSVCFGPFSPEEIAERLVRLSREWRAALARYEAGLAGVPGTAAAEELSAARAIGATLRSLANYFRLCLLKRTWTDACRAPFVEIVRDEIEAVREALPVYEADSRQGFHLEPQGYMVSPALLRAKLAQLETCAAAKS